MDDFAAFMTARYDEAEALAKAYLDCAVERKRPGPERWGYQTVLAGIPGKRAILDLYTRTLVIKEDLEARMRRGEELDELRSRDYLDAGRELAVLDTVVRHLGTEFAAHPAYKEAWKP